MGDFILLDALAQLLEERFILSFGDRRLVLESRADITHQVLQLLAGIVVQVVSLFQLLAQFFKCIVQLGIVHGRGSFLSVDKQSALSYRFSPCS